MNKRWISLFIFFLFAILQATPYDRNEAVSYAEEWQERRNGNYHDYGEWRNGVWKCLDCSNFVSQCLREGGLRFVEKLYDLLPSGCKKPKFWVDRFGCIPWAEGLHDYLTGVLGCPCIPMPPGQRWFPSGVRPGDVAFFQYWDSQEQRWRWHAVIIIGINGNTIIYAAHCTDRSDGNLLNTYVTGYLHVVFIPDQVLGCKTERPKESFDSTFCNPPKNPKFSARHQYKCCWHENLGGQWPWYSNPTGYACLSWDETNGTTWDTLISPRINLAGCSSVVFRQSSYSNLQRGGNKIIEIRGSIDNGANWSYYIGTDTLTEASLPWATNQRNVRIAWIYKGSGQYGRYWCIDDVQLLVKPGRSKDASVSEILSPKGIIAQGKIITPYVVVQNFGPEFESLSVTLKIGSNYTDVKSIRLPYIYDSVLTFTPWTATPGNYTATCYCNLSGDEFRGNDTATLNFKVVADTWVKMFPVYNGGVQAGACITSTGNETLFCVTGRNKFFASYLISQDLWKNRCPTPEYFGQGGSIAYANGNYLYALRGLASKKFYRYNIAANSWTPLADAPDKIGRGGALAYGGSGCLYALRGSNNKSFYRYNIDNNTWQTLAETPGKIEEGGSLVWTGGNFLYALRGDDKTDFYRYDISKNQWMSMAPIPAAVKFGGSLAYSPLTNKIYAFCGNNTSYFYVYNIANNTWTTRRQTPYPVKRDACLTYADCSIYGILGRGYDNDFWRYSPPVGGDYKEGEEDKNEDLEQGRIKYEPNDWLEKGSEIQLTYDPNNKYNPQYSPDGTLISYVAEDTAKGCLQIYKIPAEGGEAVNLTNDYVTYENPVWSSDGKWLIASGDDGIYKIPSNGSSPSELIVQGTIAVPKWVANDEWVVYEKWSDNGTGPKNTHNIYKVRNDGTDEVCLLTSNDEYLQPQPITDNEVICVKLKGESYQIYKIANGEEIQLTSDYCENINPSLSPDGEWITYQKLDESGYWQIYKMRTNGEEETELTTEDCHHETPVFSPDGNWIAYSKWPKDTSGAYEYSQICYISKDGGEETALNDPDGIRENPCWSPDNAYIVYQKTTEDASCGEGRKKHKQLYKIRTNLKYLVPVESLAGKLPKVFALYQNRPNPFRAATKIRYAIPIECWVNLDIFDLTGRIVKTLVNDKQKPNYYIVKWDGRDNQGKKVAQGIYFYTLRADKKIVQKKMLLLR
ncbi:MAG: DUF5050 domain-containing protein [candidate division WOR-3 bacterium]